MSAVKAVLGIGAAYLLYEWYTGAFNSPAVASVATTGITSNQSTVAAPVVQPSGVVSYGMPTVAQLQSAAGAQLQNIYQWNYFYQALTGRGGGFDAATFPVDGSTVIDAPTYLSYLKGMGLSGLGRIINLQTLFTGVPLDSGFGDQEFTALSGGLKGIVDDALMSAAYIDEGPFNEAASASTGNDVTTQDFFAAWNGQGS